jgi:acyl-coenzyme A thioesterase PaaI-like protein
MDYRGKRVKQPNSRMCFVCGLENNAGLHAKFYELEPGRVEMTWIPPAQYQGYPNVLHGGIAAALMDEAAGRTTMAGDPPRFMVTGKMEVRYRKPIPIGQPLHIVGELIRDRGRVAEAVGRIELPDGSVGAESKVWLVMPADDLIPVYDRERIGWKVYPDEDVDSNGI